MRYYGRSVWLRLLGAANALVVSFVFVVVGLQMEKGGDTFGEAVTAAIPLMVALSLVLVVAVGLVSIWLGRQSSTPAWGAYLFGSIAMLVSVAVLPRVVSPLVQSVVTVLALFGPWPFKRALQKAR